MMTDTERFSRLRHDLANPLAAVLAEVQLLLLEADGFSSETVTALRAIEEGALRMRQILREVGSPPAHSNERELE
jgi:signal transduction histidine kinase